MTDLMCFGGPLNERTMTAEGDRWIAPVSPRITAKWSPYDEPTVADLPREVVYRRQKVAYHDHRRCEPPVHDNRCIWSAWCWVAESYPMHRITDALNAVAATADFVTGRSGWMAEYP